VSTSIPTTGGIMPLRLDFAGPSTFVVHASGKVTLEEIRSSMAELLAHERFAPGVSLLSDWREATGAPSAAELRLIAQETAPLVHRGLGPVAIVCSSAFIYGVARMFAVFAEVVHANVAAFRSMDEALQWLEAQPKPAAA
jgi:hypothetical protein